MSNQNHIEGVIRLTTPLHCAQVGGTGNRTYTAKMRLTAGGKESEYLPYFPGNDLRGRLRRKAAAIVMDSLSQQKRVPIQLYVGLNSGAADNSPENELTVAEVYRARENVFMGLFGGGKRILRSRYSVSDMIPITQTTLALGMVPGKFAQISEDRDEIPVANAGSLLEYRDMFHVDDVMSMRCPAQIEALIENAGEVVSEYQQGVLSEQSLRKDEKAADVAQDKRTKKTTVANMFQLEAVAAGTPMYFRLDFGDDVTDAHIGLMLQSLRDLYEEQALGGWCRIGFGKFKVVRMNLVRDGEAFPVFSGDESCDLHKSVKSYVATAFEQVAKLSQDDMLTYFAATKEPKEPKESESQTNDAAGADKKKPKKPKKATSDSNATAGA